MGRKEPQEPTPEEIMAANAENEVAIREALTEEVPISEFATRDVGFIRLLKDHPVLKNFFPFNSHPVFLTNLDAKQVKGWQDDIDLAFGVVELESIEEEYNSGDAVLFLATAAHLKARINDSRKGYKLDLITRIRKSLEFQTPQKKKQHWWG